MNIIDALVVKFSADNSDLNRGFKESEQQVDKFGQRATKQSKVVNQRTDSMAQGFRKVRGEISGLLSLSLGAAGIGTLMTKTIGDQAGLGRLSQDLQMSARDLDAWGRVMGQVGGKAEDAQKSFQGIANEIQKRSMGMESTVVSTLHQMQVRVADQDGNARSPADIIRDVAASEKFQNAPAQQQRTLGNMLGISDSLIYLMRQGPEAMNAQLETARRNSAVDDKSVEQSQQAQRSLNELSQSLNGVWQTIFVSLEPGMQELNALLRDFGDWLRENRGEIRDFFQNVVRGTGDLIREFSRLNESTDGLAGKIIAATAALGAFKVAMGGMKTLTGMGGAGKKGFAGRAGGGLAIAAGVMGLPWLAEKADQADAYLNTTTVGKWLNDKMNDGRSPYQAAKDAWSAGSEAVSEAGGKQPGSYEKAMSYFMSRGWTREQSAGIAANLKRESNFDPTASGDGGRAYGIAQWHPDRQEEFKKQYGKHISRSSFREQLDFIQHELTQGNERAAGNALRQASTAYQAAEVVTRKYERPADQDGESRRRGQRAMAYNRDYQEGQNARQEQRINRQAYLAAMSVGAASSPQVADNSSRTSNDNRSENNIGSISVYTQATDANGIAKDMGVALRGNPLLNWSGAGQY